MIFSIILAAGEGTRMKSKLPKVMHKICGKPLLSHVINTAKASGIDKNIVIVGNGSDLVQKGIEEEVFFVEQPIGEGVPYGTGFAVMQAKDYIEDDSHVIILYGDTPLITSETINNTIEFHKKGNYEATVLSADFDDPTGYGRIIRDSNGNVTSIVEHKDASEEERNIKEINSGIYCFNGKSLKLALDRLDSNNAQNEYYITDAIKILNDLGLKVGGYKILDKEEIFGINSRIQLAEAEKVMRKRINNAHMANGVTIINPDNTYIDADVKIERDTIIYPGVIIEGKSNIGEDCIIGQNSRIVDSHVGNEVDIQISTILESKIGDNAHIGPYAYLRPNSEIGKNVKIGDFVEVKNSKIEDNSKASHLSYIGDAYVGKGVNIGCGVVFVNYDGKEKHKTIVQDNAFIGCNTNLVSPVEVEEGAYIAAGSTITERVPKESLSIARARQVNKEGWVKKKGLKK
ncbi:bifunctional UDP-N-acetylglucosamine diphosphorylase/glucosamine-1-phosphate N-acetyltransferase GlmU [Proteiniborus sp. MB09-C3]|uniref:bifunctional UDP-N-acetylglucosamine diphosphorylase/glucosamine-1-phosphate N-acetyltransferase GlmU n=1 Tax=Proteiniborus sp. MB09-C3 TaxID=3050072 RepID=UPI002556428B|nr:bifunctional UDP-N-acetylglucosamine diphosphorylase/glucosamine-1-phosphate N-acetyltransferase GlmU [Proteiniborus sp. MB09-C3]WIV13036.1 bifunctional UDP-N-acetylglucosamine diphosphorylase/glucosamine-1-phosphate N-acetyltransferase GlmU [Proteiniborus sp. MB09-C3]